MKLTNRLGLPEAFVRAVQNDPYTNHGTLSVTRLIRPPQMVRLEEKHWEDLEEDAADRVWTILGQAGHSVLERSQQDGDVVEQRLYMKVDGTKISGQLDRLTKDGVLVDWKFTSVWAVSDCLKNGIKPEWEQQLNMLSALVRAGYQQNVSSLHTPPIYENAGRLPEPKALRIVAVCRDWRPFESKKTDDYPHKVEVLKASLWPHEKAMEFIRERVRLHLMENPIPCTDEERWAKPEKWAVMGPKRALRLLPTEKDAIEWAHDEGIDKPKIERRPATYTRCEGYCSVAKFCPQYETSNAT